MACLLLTVACVVCSPALPRVRAESPAGGRQLERLDRGLVVVPRGPGYFLSWRWLLSDPLEAQFEVLRADGEAAPRPIATVGAEQGTNFWDQDVPSGVAPRYAVRLKDVSTSGASVGFAAGSEPVRPWSGAWREIPLQTLSGYRPGDVSVGDLTGDGRYELVVHQLDRPRDNSHSGVTGRPLLEAYTLEGELLWRIDLGVNIREGEHYTQFMVYDLDGDGLAEVACKTADGTVDGTGAVIGDAAQDYRILDSDDRRYGRVLDGPEYLTVFDGRTGAAVSTVDYVPGREPIDGWGGIGGNGGNDAYGNRCDRFLACVAYLDGQRPSLVMCRGVYGRTVMVAWDFRDGTLRQRWTFDSGVAYPPYDEASPYSGMGGHSLAVADVDQDGRDEIVYQAMALDDDGTGLYSTGLRHGDVVHVTDVDPSHPGQEVFSVQENEGRTVRFQTPGAVLRAAGSGKFLWSHSPGIDVGGGLVADIDPRHEGLEVWGGPGGLRTARGETIGRAPRGSRFAIWWDGDLLRELVRGAAVVKWDWESQRSFPLLETGDATAPRGPNLVADVLGDWREELLLVGPDGKSLRLYTTNHPTAHRLVTLMQEPQYRLGIAWQNVAYNKPAYPAYYLGTGMQTPARPRARLVSPAAP